MTPHRRASGVNEHREWGAGPDQWLLPAEPLLDKFGLGLAGLAWLAVTAWAILWLHPLGWWTQGPLWAHELVVLALGSDAPHLMNARGLEVFTDVFFWLNALVAMGIAGLVGHRLSRHSLAQRWVLRRTVGVGEAGEAGEPGELGELGEPGEGGAPQDTRWSWWALDAGGQATDVRQGEVNVRLDLGPWLLLQARPAADRWNSDWMLVRPTLLGPQGAAGVSLRAALNAR